MRKCSRSAVRCSRRLDGPWKEHRADGLTGRERDGSPGFGEAARAREPPKPTAINIVWKEPQPLARERAPRWSKEAPPGEGFSDLLRDQTVFEGAPVL
jgi:hypothetical protein